MEGLGCFGLPVFPAHEVVDGFMLTCTTAVVTLWRSKACVPEEMSSCRNGAWSRCFAASEMQVLSQRGMLSLLSVCLGMS